MAHHQISPCQYKRAILFCLLGRGKRRQGQALAGSGADKGPPCARSFLGFFTESSVKNCFQSRAHLAGDLFHLNSMNSPVQSGRLKVQAGGRFSNARQAEVAAATLSDGTAPVGGRATS